MKDAHFLLKKLLPTLGLFLVLLLVAIFLEYYSTRKEDNRSTLFSYYELAQIKEINVKDMVFILDSESLQTWDLLAQKKFLTNKLISSEIRNDWSKIFVKEKVLNPSEDLKLFFKNNVLGNLSWKNSDDKIESWFIYPVNNETGQFWIKKISENNEVVYFLCESEIDFDGFYQTVDEGKRISFLHFSQYFLNPIQKLWQMNLWHDAKNLSLTTNKSTLFSIDILGNTLTSNSNIGLLTNKSLIKEYVNMVLSLVPVSVDILDESHLEKLNNSTSFNIKFTNTILGDINFGISNEGIFSRERNLLFKFVINPEEKLIVLPDRFYVPRILSLYELAMHSNEDITLMNSSTNVEKIFTWKDVFNDQAGNKFFCFLINCDYDKHDESDIQPSKVIPYFQAKNVARNDSNTLLQRPNFIIKTKKINYKFYISEQKIEVLENDSILYVFISSLIPSIPQIFN